MIGLSKSVSYTLSTPCRMHATRSMPIPVSMLRSGSGPRIRNPPWRRRSPLVLHEHEVPDLDVAVFVDLRSAFDAVVGTAVVEDLRRRPARPGDAHRPIVVLHPTALDALRRDTDFAPNLLGLVVVEGTPSATAASGRCRNRRRRPDRSAVTRRTRWPPLEIVAEREIAAIWKNVLWRVVMPTSSISSVRTHFWTLVARRNGGVCSPRKYGLKGTMPALTNIRFGSSRISGALATSVCRT